MKLSTFTKPGDSDVVPAEYHQQISVGGKVYIVELEPECWIGSSRLGILVSGKHGGGTYRSPLSFKRAKLTHLQSLIKRIKPARCRYKQCNQSYLQDDMMKKVNPLRLCEEHRLKALNEVSEKLAAKERIESAQFDAKKKAKGFRYKATVWIHRDDWSDYAVILYFEKRPSQKELRAVAKKQRSRILNDHTVEKL